MIVLPTSRTSLARSCVGDAFVALPVHKHLFAVCPRTRITLFDSRMARRSKITNLDGRGSGGNNVRTTSGRPMMANPKTWSGPDGLVVPTFAAVLYRPASTVLVLVHPSPYFAVAQLNPWHTTRAPKRNGFGALHRGADSMTGQMAVSLWASRGFAG